MLKRSRLNRNVNSDNKTRLKCQPLSSVSSEVCDKLRDVAKAKVVGARHKYLTIGWDKAHKFVYEQRPKFITVMGRKYPVDADSWDLVVKLEEQEEREKFWKRYQK